MRWPSLLILALVAGCLDSPTTSDPSAGEPVAAPALAGPLPADDEGPAPEPGPQSARTTGPSAERSNDTEARAANPNNFRYTGSVDLLEQGRVIDFVFGTPVPVKSAHLLAWLEGTRDSLATSPGRACYILEVRRYDEAEFKEWGKQGTCDTVGTFLTSYEEGWRFGPRDVMSLDEDAFCICVYRLTLKAQEQANELFWDISVEYEGHAPSSPPPAPMHWDGQLGQVALPAAGPYSECGVPLTACYSHFFRIDGTFDLVATLSWDLPTNDLDLYLYRIVPGHDYIEVSRDGVNDRTDLPTTEQVLRHAALAPGDYRLLVVPHHGVKIDYRLDAVFQ